MREKGKERCHEAGPCQEHHLGEGVQCGGGEQTSGRRRGLKVGNFF